MAVIKCKMCGGDITVNEDKTLGMCEYCGSMMTLPNVSDDQRAAMFNRGNHFRRIGEFDKALAIYENIVRENDADAEAHWCCALCRFGIEYVEDPATYEYIPTCHRASFDSFLEDVDYLAAIEYSDGITRRQYQKDAAKIAEIQKGILATSQNEEPFDVFICYKETDDATNERTRDSIDAQEIYYQLTNEGYRVFFSRITLEDKVGTEYEPYIFAALNSAKVMVVIGSKPEYLNAVWVKNEWSRFIALMRKDRSKLLIPCYKDMDPYDLPEQLSVLQSYDMTKIGFMQDLIRGIKKVAAKEDQKPVKAEAIVVNAGGADTGPLLRRACMFLEDGNWSSADEYAEKVLDLEPENAEVYLVKLMAEVKVRTRADLSQGPVNMAESDNYKKAMRFGAQELRTEIAEYYQVIIKRSEDARLNHEYKVAFDRMTNARTEMDYKAAASIFQSLGNFRDSQTLIERCNENAEAARRKAEQEKQIALQKAADARLKAEQEKQQIHQIAKKIIETFQTTDKAQELSSPEYMLTAAKQQVTSLATALNEYNALELETNKPKTYIQSVDARISELSSKRKELGLFATKEKESIDRELEVLKFGKKNAENHLKELAEKIGAYHQTKAEMEEDLAAARQTVTRLEKEVEQKRIQGKNTYTITEAFQLMQNNKIIAREVALVGKKATLDPIAAAVLGVTDQISFGRYQTTTANTAPIEWFVLARERSKLLLISRYVLDVRPYNSVKKQIVWENCTLRKWLNNEFLHLAFTDAERNQILHTKVTAENNPIFRTNSGLDTVDKVFLLSIGEVEKIFPQIGFSTICAPTEYARSKGVISNNQSRVDGNTSCMWWLRSPGRSTDSAAVVKSDGTVDERGRSVREDYCAVRPAIWVDLYPGLSL